MTDELKKKAGTAVYRGGQLGLALTVFYQLFFGDVKRIAENVEYIKLEVVDQKTKIATLEADNKHLQFELAEHKQDDKDIHKSLWKTRGKSAYSQSKSNLE